MTHGVRTSHSHFIQEMFPRFVECCISGKCACKVCADVTAGRAGRMQLLCSALVLVCVPAVFPTEGKLRLVRIQRIQTLKL